MQQEISSYIHELVDATAKIYEVPKEEVNILPLAGADDLFECVIEFATSRKIIVRDAIFDSYKTDDLQSFRYKLEQAFLRNPENFELVYFAN